MKKLTVIPVGFGNRSRRYCEYAKAFPDELEVVGVAEPNDDRRNDAVKEFGLPDENVFKSWEELAEKPKMADFVIIGTQDKDHHKPTLALIEKGYDILLEKPMAPTAKECKEMLEAAEKKGVKVIVCHVLRFTSFWNAIKDLIDDGTIGEIQSMTHMENVGNVHQAHSFTRGNWRNTAESSPMILAKTCHDMDIMQWLVGKDCKQVSSFGSLSYFVHENRPEGAPDRCLDGCPHADTCYYNAEKIYLHDEKNKWMRATVTTESATPTDEQIIKALKTGPYGRCVFACDNDVVDHQVVNLEFENGCTASFSMNAFNEGGRFIRIFGTNAELYGEMENNIIKVYSYKTQETTTYTFDQKGADISSGHGGGDMGIMRDTVRYFCGEGLSKGICTLRTSYMNHLISFAAEKARLENRVVNLNEFSDEL